MLISSQEEFSEKIICPIIEYFLFKILKYQSENIDQTICFVSREGYYLQNIYNKLVTSLSGFNDSKILYSSRHIATRILNLSLPDYLKVLSLHRFAGSYEDFLNNRLNICLKETNTDCQIKLFSKPIDTQKDLKPFIDIFNKFKNEIRNESSRLQNEMKFQIESFPKKLVIIDFGIHGTVNKSITKFTQNVAGYYLIGSHKNFWNLTNYKFIIAEEDISWSRVGAIFESIFTAPYGTVRDLKDGNVIFDPYTAECQDIIFRDRISDLVYKKIIELERVFDFKNKKLEQDLASKILNVVNNFINGNFKISENISKHFHFENTFINKHNRKLLEV